MVVFPNAKINLGLWVVERREDGFHNIESCFYPVPWTDILEFIESDRTEFTSSGIPIPGNPAENLVVKAYEILKAEYRLPELRIHLHKQIPIGAGLGGGSADASFMLTGLNNFFGLGISVPRLEEFAGALGADCPFFIQNTAKMVTGTGNQFSQITMDLSGYWIAIIYPNLHVSTPRAYRSLTPRQRNTDLDYYLNRPINTWKADIGNDFEQFVYRKYPELSRIKDRFYELGAEFSLMSGSGSSVYAISTHELDLEEFNTFQVFTTQL
jgi:4-diphosphocytidyl-2-C-methyl-D-erythritol kinase